MLVDCGIPESQIKIKTANINELKGVDLKSEECQVRYIITVNALKEGWDCPFAYILASLANKTSNIDVEQILGRILRQPYTRKHKSILLNQSYVYSCSSNFQATLESIVKGLNGAGFSDKDYRVAELENTEPKKITVEQRETLDFTSTSMENPTTASTGATNVKTSATEYMDDSVDTSYVSKQTSSNSTIDSIKYQIRQAEAAAQKAEQQQKDDLFSNPTGVAEEVKEKQKLNMTKIQEKHLARAKKISLPQFFIKTPNNGFFIDEDSHKLLDKTDLYVNFNLDEQDKKLDLINIGNNNIAVFDLTEENDYLLKRIDINSQQTMLIQQTYAMYGRELKIEQFAKQIGKSIRLDAISEPKITNYAKAVLANYNDEELQMLFDNQQNVMAAFSKKIKSLLIHHSEKKFKDFLTTGKITIEPSYKFAEEIILEKKESSLQRTLYTSEHGDMNPLEKKVAVYISQLPNVVFWHRNLERGKGFCINGFINHYPDFIVLTEKGNIVIVETKGDDRTNTDSKAKLSLGTKWADKAGSQYHYFMVFENNEIEGSKSITEFINLLKQM
jgi:type III restriction enzyme